MKKAFNPLDEKLVNKIFPSFNEAKEWGEKVFRYKKKNHPLHQNAIWIYAFQGDAEFFPHHAGTNYIAQNYPSRVAGKYFPPLLLIK